MKGRLALGADIQATQGESFLGRHRALTGVSLASALGREVQSPYVALIKRLGLALLHRPGGDLMHGEETSVKRPERSLGPKK